VKRMFILQPLPHTSRGNAIQAIREAANGLVVTISEPTRNLEQNACMWATLTDIAKQVEWHGRKLDAESWKHIFTSSLQKMDVVPNLEGTGFVALGLSTSKMTKRQMSDLIELATAFGAQRGVIWSDKP
jgi:hypothetical protein